MSNAAFDIDSFDFLYNTLTLELIDLASHLSNAACNQAYFYKITPSVENSEHFKVEKFTNRKAQGWIGSSLTQMTLTEDAIGRTRITPGIIIFPLSAYDFVNQLIEKINSTKDEIQSLLSTHDLHKLRTTLAQKNALCSLVMLTRKLHVLKCDESTTISVTWYMRSGMRVLREKDFSTRIHKAVQNEILDFSKGKEYLELFQKNQNSHSFRLKRNVIPTTIYNIWKTGSSKDKTQFNGQTPLFVFSDCEMQIKHLENNFGSKSRSIRNDATPATDLLIPELQIYMSKINKE
ncbi:DNA replication terminus site-binding protein [Shewanella oncorhynchi]|uniref:DNA replication terminus site-binding protein n=1 Tax=Shewanella oncorhynchi TaxID=2726434 RepID=UPI003D7A4AAC